MLTISIMARFGPWVLLRVEDLAPDKAHWQHCERCGEHIRYVYVCQVDGETKEWRIGSTCGPTLIKVSEAIWDKVAKAVARDLCLLHRALRLKPLEQGPRPWGGHLGADWLDRIIECLRAGETDKHYLARSGTRRIENLKFIQTRLGLAEKHHALGPFQMGAGK